MLTKAGVNAAAIKAAFDAAETETALDKACAEAAERGVFGSPTFFVDGEIYFGKDRLRDVEDAITASK